MSNLLNSFLKKIIFMALFPAVIFLFLSLIFKEQADKRSSDSSINNQNYTQGKIPKYLRPDSAAIKRTQKLLVPLDTTFTRIPKTILNSKFNDHPDLMQIQRARFDEKTGVPRALYFLDEGPYEGSPDHMARTYIKTMSDVFLLRPDLSDLVTAKVQESNSGFHIKLQQTYNNIPVYRSSIVITINRDNKVVFVTNDYKPDISVQNLQPSISVNRIYQIVFDHLNIKETHTGFPQSDLIIYAENEPAVLAYQVKIAAKNPSGSWEVIVNALSANIISVRNLRKYADGLGYIFNPDPLTTAGAKYGDPGFIDNNDSNSVQLENERQLVFLTDISYDGAVYTLSGPYCTIEDWDSPEVAPVTGINPDDFKFTRDNDGFEDVMVYYHIDQIHRYVNDIVVWPIAPELATHADPHGADGADNSYFDPLLNKLSFGEGGVDDAEDADVIWHEMGHALQEAIAEWSLKGGEADHIGEGFSDYWAGSYSSSLSLYNSDWIFNWDGHNEFDDGRILNDTTKYPDGGVAGWNIYEAGQIWSSVLTQLWYDIGRTTMDEYALEGQTYLGDNPTMSDYAAAILMADHWSSDGGINMLLMQEKFCEKGILGCMVDTFFKALDRNNDWHNPSVPFPGTFQFFGMHLRYDIGVHNNGFLHFVWDYPGALNNPLSFPNDNKLAMIAPFWADVDTRNPDCGVVYYNYRYLPNRTVIVWDRVGYFDQHSDKLNSFQVILTEGDDPLIGIGNNICFSYGDMQWTTGDASGGVNGFGGNPAMIGATRGDSINYFTFGRFDHEGEDYDGPGGNPDGVSFLDCKYFCFDISKGIGKISGKVFNDDNENRIWEPGEQAVQGGMIELIPGPQYTTTDSAGAYCFENLSLDSSYTVSLVKKSYWIQTWPRNDRPLGVDFSLGYETNTKNMDFGIKDLNTTDLCISLAGGAARPGFTKTYGLRFGNRGGLESNGFVTLVLPQGVFYLGGSGGNYDTTAHSIIWDVGLVPGRYFASLSAKILIPNTMPIGRVLRAHATIGPLEGDSFPANNIDWEPIGEGGATVTGSWDPNDKQVSPQGIGPSGIIAQTDTLDYLIRFQNVGTDTAFNIVIKDTIDPSLDLATLELGASIHDYTFSINPPRELVFTFNNILLPDSNVNEPASHGLIKFSILPDQTVPPGTDIYNSAGIYFDFNLPVITNLVQNRISVDTVGNIVNKNQDILPIVYSLAQNYPNPFNPSTTIEFTVPKPEYVELKVYNILGKVVAELVSNNLPAGMHQYQFDGKNLASGIYYYQLVAGEYREARKMILLR